MTLADLTGSRPWSLAGWTMMHFFWVGGLAGLFAAVIRRSLRHSGPEVRYAAALCSLLGIGIAPVVLAVWMAASPPASQLGPNRISDPIASSRSPSVEDLPKDLDLKPFVLTSRGSKPVAMAPLLALRGWSIPIPVWIARLANALPWVWAAGSPITFAVLALGLVGSERLRKNVRQVEPGEEIESLCRRLGESLGIVRQVGLGISDRIAMPILIGFVRPLILLPSVALTGWDVEQVEMVLLHELAHVRRRDNLVNLAQRVLESVLFFHPAIWWVSAWARLEREQCCDSTVVSRTGRRRPYAELLASLAAPRPAPQTVSAFAAHPLVARIRLILEPEVPPMKFHRTAITIAAALTLLPTSRSREAIDRAGRKPSLRPSPSSNPSPIAIRSGATSTSGSPRCIPSSRP
jgi:beta-lactamase regulating signal transducer with metallopeptidase domain